MQRAGPRVSDRPPQAAGAAARTVGSGSMLEVVTGHRSRCHPSRRRELEVAHCAKSRRHAGCWRASGTWGGLSTGERSGAQRASDVTAASKARRSDVTGCAISWATVRTRSAPGAIYQRGSDASSLKCRATLSACSTTALRTSIDELLVAPKSSLNESISGCIAFNARVMS